ncbi:MAG: type II toxin-antitoxin system VapC family toxin [Alphaproteobacteria bacterium]|nr:type II toxin-antitoxin system VapC family toxin [Alphaproteobacteria bacterium]
MIVLDTSVLISILLRSPDLKTLSRRLFSDTDRRISAVSVVEATMVLSRNHADPQDLLSKHFAHAAISVIPVDQDHIRWAQIAFMKFGKGRHPARLNFGDCFSYAAAKVLNARLLFVGEDFSQTDIRAA